MTLLQTACRKRFVPKSPGAGRFHTAGQLHHPKLWEEKLDSMKNAEFKPAVAPVIPSLLAWELMSAGAPEWEAKKPKPEIDDCHSGGN